MEMMRSKKAVFFTISAIILVSVMYMGINAYKTDRLRQRSFVLEERIKSVDYFIGDIEKDIERGSYIASFRALLAIQQRITAKGEFIPDLDAAFTELVINGTIDGESMSVMNDTELNKWIDKIKYEAGKSAIDLDYIIRDVELVHKDPWIVETRLSVTLNISDDRGTARWIRNQTINSTLNIILFEDPLYTVNTSGRVINIIEKSNITDFVDGNDTTNLSYHAENSLYRESNSSPSYLMRLEGNLASSDYGIESIVNLRTLQTAEVEIDTTKSCIDYIYFSANNPQSWLINNTFNWLRLDNESDHLAIYEVENLTITS
jgi:hypothetical protein